MPKYDQEELHQKYRVRPRLTKKDSKAKKAKRKGPKPHSRVRKAAPGRKTAHVPSMFGKNKKNQEAERRYKEQQRVFKELTGLFRTGWPSEGCLGFLARLHDRIQEGDIDAECWLDAIIQESEMFKSHLIREKLYPED